MNKKVPIKPDLTDPLWKECVRRFKAEVKSVPNEHYQAYAPNYYYRSTRAALRVTDFDWYLLDDELILREKKIGV